MDEKELLQYALNEIQGLRNQNQVQSARLSMFDDMMLVFRTPPAYSTSGGMSPDIAYQIQKRLKELETPAAGTQATAQ